MTNEESNDLRELCTVAQNEMDPEKLMELVREINRVFEVAEERMKTRPDQGQHEATKIPEGED